MINVSGLLAAFGLLTLDDHVPVIRNMFGYKALMLAALALPTIRSV